MSNRILPYPPALGLNGRSNNHQTNGALNWWERAQDDAWWQGEEWQALRQQVLGFTRNLYLRWREGSRQRSKYLGKAPVQGDKSPTLVTQRLVA